MLPTKIDVRNPDAQVISKFVICKKYLNTFNTKKNKYQNFSWNMCTNPGKYVITLTLVKSQKCKLNVTWSKCTVLPDC